MSKNKLTSKKLKGLTLHFMPFSEISGLDSIERIKKLLNVVLDNKVVILQGTLKPEEETRLIENTMIMVGNIKGFKGVELAVIEPDNEEAPFTSRLRHGIANMLVRDQDALTVIGPASIIKEIKKDPKKIELMFKR